MEITEGWSMYNSLIDEVDQLIKIYDYCETNKSRWKTNLRVGFSYQIINENQI